METLFQTSREPKELELGKSDDGRLRIVITVRKLGMMTSVEYFLDQNEARLLSQALSK